MAAIPRLPPHRKRLTAANRSPPDGAESPKRKSHRPLILKMWKMLNGRRLAILMVHGHRAAVKQMIPTLWNRRSRKTCPNALMGNGSSSSSTAARVKSLFVQILMPATVATRKAALMLAPLWDRPKDTEPAPKMDVNPPRRTRKKREPHED